MEAGVVATSSLDFSAEQREKVRASSGTSGSMGSSMCSIGVAKTMDMTDAIKKSARRRAEMRLALDSTQNGYGNNSILTARFRVRAASTRKLFFHTLPIGHIGSTYSPCYM